MTPHRTTRGYRLESTWQASGAFTGSGIDISIIERYCAGCDQWFEERGVTGWIRWESTHGDHSKM